MKSRAAFDALVAPYPRVHLYAAEPGARAILLEARRALEDTGKMGLWLADGWAAEREPSLPAPEILSQQAKPGEALMLGPQHGFARTHAVIRLCRRLDIASIFVMDAWKNYRRHFADRDGPILPDIIAAPDRVAEQGLRAEMSAAELAGARIVVVGHWANEAKVERIKALEAAQVRQLRDGLCPPEKKLAALLLDPSHQPNDPELGYDAVSVLTQLPRWLARLPQPPVVAIKPHPRERTGALDDALAGWKDRPHSLFTGDTDMLIAAADAVWGCTTSALLIAKDCGKPIVSFQPGRNAEGVRASNPHIEPFVVDLW